MDKAEVPRMETGPKPITINEYGTRTQWPQKKRRRGGKIRRLKIWKGTMLRIINSKPPPSSELSISMWQKVKEIELIISDELSRRKQERLKLNS